MKATPAAFDNSDPVRQHTPEQTNRQIDARTEENVRSYGVLPRDQITDRIRDLEKEWDMERWLETNASSLALIGLILGVTVHKRLLFIPGAVLPFLLLHAIQGWCPPVPLFRRFGVRTRQEIDQEKYALKIMRGDFDHVAEVTDRLRRAIEAYRAAQI